MDLHILLIFIPTFFLVAVSPGLNMMLAMALGMSIGVRRALWMMYGELIGVATVAICATLGVAAIMLHYPMIFAVLKYIGGAYLIYLGWQMWRSKGRLAVGAHAHQVLPTSRVVLFSQGLVTALVNPKGWAFMVSLLPPFINIGSPLLPQLSILVAIILSLEFSSMLLYASGGKWLRVLLQTPKNVRIINRITGTLMMGIGVWLGVG